MSKPYGDADEDVEHVALRRMGYQPTISTQSNLLRVGPTQRRGHQVPGLVGTLPTHRAKVRYF